MLGRHKSIRLAPAALLALCALAPASFAGTIFVPACTVPRCITLVGLADGVADPVGAFMVVTRSSGNNPVSNVNVEVSFMDCADVRIGAQQAAGITVDVARRSVRAITDATGAARFTLSGAAMGAAGSGVQSAKIYADGMYLGSVTVRALDLDGSGGVGLADFALLASDFYSETYVGRSDFDCSGTVGMVDLSIWAASFYSHHSAQSPAAYAW
jgi:hypothetical protein